MAGGKNHMYTRKRQDRNHRRDTVVLSTSSTHVYYTPQDLDKSQLEIPSQIELFSVMRNY